MIVKPPTAGREARRYTAARGGVHTRQMPTLLREVSSVRTVGFQDAVADLGTHRWCGVEVPYSRAQVYQVLKGRTRSLPLLRRIAERRPDLFGLRFVAPDVRAWWQSQNPLPGGGCRAGV